MIRYQFLQTFSYPVYLFEIYYDNFSFSKLTRKCHCFKFLDLQSAGDTLERPDVVLYKELVEGKICCMLRYQALYRSLRRED